MVDGVAYFGVSVFSPRSSRQDPAIDSELAAFDLIAGKLLWRRVVPTKGLLNVISAPHLGEASTYRAMGVDHGEVSSTSNRQLGETSKAVEKLESDSSVKSASPGAARKELLSNEKVQAAVQKLKALGYPIKVSSISCIAFLLLP